MCRIAAKLKVLAWCMVAVLLQIAAYKVAIKLGVSRVDLLKNLPANIASTASAIIAVAIALLSKPVAKVSCRVEEYDEEWRVGAYVHISNLYPYALSRLRASFVAAPTIILQHPPDSLPAGTTIVLHIETSFHGDSEDAQEALNLTTQRRLRIMVGWWDPASCKIMRRHLRIANPYYVRRRSSMKPKAPALGD